MALIVETGEGLENANTFLSLLDADAYHLELNNTDWSLATELERTAALLKAAKYLCAFRFKGLKSVHDQGLEWPRYDARDRDGYLIASDFIPRKIKEAQAEAALRALSQDLTPDLERGGKVSSETVKVGPIEESKSYEAGSSARTQWTAVTDLIAEYLAPSGLKLKRS